MSQKSEQIGARIKIWRKHLDLTQVGFAELAGVHIGVLKKYERGANVPGGEVLAAFSETGLNINWLLTGEGDILAPEPNDDHLDMPKTLPRSLDYYQSQFDKMFELLLQLDEDERSDALDEMLTKVKEVARVQKMEKMLEQLEIKSDEA